jgi:hypothetical protein
VVIDSIDTKIGFHKVKADTQSIESRGHLLRWEDVDGLTFFRKAIIQNGTRFLYGHIVVSGPRTTISLKAYLKPWETAPENKDYNALCTLALRTAGERILRGMYDAVENDNGVTIGNIGVQRSGLSHRGIVGRVKYLTWDEYLSVRALLGRRIVYAKPSTGRRAPTFAWISNETLNAPLLEPLLRAVHSMPR